MPKGAKKQDNVLERFWFIYQTEEDKKGLVSAMSLDHALTIANLQETAPIAWVQLVDRTAVHQYMHDEPYRIINKAVEHTVSMLNGSVISFITQSCDDTHRIFFDSAEVYDIAEQAGRYGLGYMRCSNRLSAKDGEWFGYFVLNDYGVQVRLHLTKRLLNAIKTYRNQKEMAYVTYNGKSSESGGRLLQRDSCGDQELQAWIRQAISSSERSYVYSLFTGIQDQRNL